VIVSHQYPHLKVRYQVRSLTIEELTYVDTGFDGGLVVSVRRLSELGTPDDYPIIELGDGSEIVAAEYSGEAEIGELRTPRKYSLYR